MRLANGYQGDLCRRTMCAACRFIQALAHASDSFRQQKGRIRFCHHL
jgi:hypothetical protein